MSKRIILTGFGFVITFIVLFGFYWSSEPAVFSVQQKTEEKLALAGNDYVVGSTTTVALITVAKTLLNKPGGYLSSDVSPPGIYLDNIPSWEFGALVEVRDLAVALVRLPQSGHIIDQRLPC